MKQIVTGCRDCPFCYDESDGCMDLYCHHPGSQYQVGYFKDGEWFPIELPKHKFDELVALSKKTTIDEDGFEKGVFLDPAILGDEFKHLVPHAWTVYPMTFAPIHYRGDDHDKYFEDKYHSAPKTPSWCPLRKEDLTISIREKLKKFK